MILAGLIQISKNGSPKVEFEVSKVSFLVSDCGKDEIFMGN